MENRRKILIHDGHCGFCDSMVARFRVWDHQGLFSYISSTSEAAIPYLAGLEGEADPVQTVILINEGGALVRSDAVLALLITLGGWRGFLARLARAIPRSWRDAVYDLVARNRHRIPTCPVPEESPGTD
jgi:predicted DCC family thiol-disulfide oxidoreductase YuxK